MTKPTTTQNNTATVGAQFIAPEASPEHGQKGGVSGWREYELQELVDVRDGTHDSPKESAIGKHLVTSKHIKNGKIDLTSAYKISENDFELVNKRSKVDQWDILFSMIGTIGEMAIVTDRPEFAIKNVGLFKTNGNKLLSQWIYYYFKSTEAQAEIQASLKGSTQQYITLGDLRVFPIKIPSEKEQKAIAAMLSSLDDKIDLLHRQNQTLEAMAQTLFRQWFIEEALEDWEEVPLSTLFEISSGKGLSKENFLDDGIYRVLGANGIIGRTDNYNFFEKLIYTGRVGTLGNIFIINTEPVWLSDNTLVMRNIKYFYFTYFTLKNSNLKDYNAGSTQPLLRQSDLKEIPYLQPPVEKMQEFESFAAINFTKIETNTKQIQTLTQLRDTLLPKLMSGEVRVEIVTETINGFN